jgi:hypothetical protein
MSDPLLSKPAVSSELSFVWKESQEILLRLLEKGRKMGWHRVGQPFPHSIEGRSGWGVWVTIFLD